jgi:hypothetical protein
MGVSLIYIPLYTTFDALVLNTRKEEPIRVEQIGLNPKARSLVPPTSLGVQRATSGQGASSPGASKSLLDRVSQAPT